MNFQQLKAIIKLRWRMSYNQWRKAGKVNAIISTVFAALAAIAAITAFVMTLVAGNQLLGFLIPDHHLVMWMVIVGVLMFAWSIALLTELQRSELLSLENLLHLPVSLKGAFLLNYLTSWFSFTIMFFLPVMVGLCISLPIVHGNMMWWVTPLAFAFLFMLTAVTYQFRGWLGRLMQNKRTRGTVIAVITIGFVTLSQIPQLLTMSSRDGKSKKERRRAKIEVVKERKKRIAAEWTIVAERLEGTSPAELKTQQAEFEQRFQANVDDHEQLDDDDFGWTVTAYNAACPVTWLPHGVRAASLGDWKAPALGTLGMFLIGGLSLSMSYRGTMKAYTQTGKTKSAIGSVAKQTTAQPAASTTHPEKKRLIEKDVPLASPQTSAIAMSSIQSLLRAHEAKMALIMPIVMLCMFGGMSISRGSSPPLLARPLFGLGVLGVSMFGLSQFAMNMFGLDRNGFKTYIMMPVERWRVLLGKNISLLPILVGMMLILLIIFQCVMPMQFLHLLATLILIIPSSLIFLMMGNYVSTQVPVAMMFGSMKPMQPKFGTMLLQALFVMLSPLTLLPCAIAYGIEIGLDKWLKVGWVPVYVVFAVIYAAVVVWAYSRILKAQGSFLQSREQKILAIVVAQNE